MAMGFMVLHVAQAAMEGIVAECKRLAEKSRKHVGVYLTVDTLEFLHRGGRIGGAQRFLGTALNLKPVLTVEGGRVEPWNGCARVERHWTAWSNWWRRDAQASHRCVSQRSTQTPKQTRRSCSTRSHRL